MNMATIRVINGLVVTPHGIINGGVWAENGVIGLVGDNRQLPAADETLDARGRFLLKARLRVGNTGSLAGWAQARPAICEAMQIQDIGLIAKQTGARAYIPHVSSEEGVRAIEYLKHRNVRIIGETCPHYLVSRFPWGAGAFGKVNPPVRDGSDRDYLWAALADGRLEALGSDNCRYMSSEKSEGDLWDAIPGFSEIGLSLAIMLTDGIAEKRLDWPALARVASEYPARCFALYPAKGAIQSGADADLVIVDPEEEWTVRADEFSYDVDSSLYEGIPMRGRPVTTIRRGEVVAEKGWVARDGGRYVDTPQVPSP
jgi:dihydropyrimidinase